MYYCNECLEGYILYEENSICGIPPDCGVGSYIEDDLTCVLCPEGCSICESLEVCTDCMDDYSLNEVD